MQFWIRHVFLIALCVIAPFVAALYFDTQTEVERVRESGLYGTKIAERAFRNRMQLEAGRATGEAISLAQTISQPRLFDNLNSRNERRRTDTEQLIEDALGAVGTKESFVSVVDPSGMVIWTRGSGAFAPGRSIVGHPLFLRTQMGYAIDGPWGEGDNVALIAAAPIVENGVAKGALFQGRLVGPAVMKAMAADLGFDVSLVRGDQVVATSLSKPLAEEFAKATAASSDPVHGGRLDKPLRHDFIPFLPLFLNPRAEGLPYTSIARAQLGAPSSRWVISVKSTANLEQLVSRQYILLGVLFASLGLAVLIGLINHRTFVTPIKRIEKHLSELQFGKGELEMPEARVSRAYRRVVRLINMTVQKIPTRTLGSQTMTVGLPNVTGELDALQPNAEMNKPSTDDLLSQSFRPITQETSLDSIESSKPISDNAVGSMLPGNKSEDVIGEPIEPADLSMFPPAPQTTDESSAVEAAIASMSDPAPVMGGLEAPMRPKSAADIRGAMPALGEASPSAEMPSPFMPSQSEYLRVGDPLSMPSAVPEAIIPPGDHTSGRVRTGGSLELGGYAGLGDAAPAPPVGEFAPEATVVSPVAEALLAQSAARDDEHPAITDDKPDATVVANVPADLLAQSAGGAPPAGPARSDPNGLDAADHAHFKQVYERFIDLRKRCGETTAELAFDRFLSKLTKNRAALMKKYNCRTVRFQVYEKDGKAALKATPVRAR